MIELRNKQTSSPIGSITQEQLAFLVGFLEEESEDDQDYWLNPETLELMREAGADAGLLAMLTQAMTGSEELEIEWTKAA
ncbi:hypothetical protein [Polaromonas aquatica]|uniref:hypothetical protein n=1 Tax=Polaromonas aquatica TaxID=332657 RepID=UPI003D658F82